MKKVISLWMGMLSFCLMVSVFAAEPPEESDTVVSLRKEKVDSDFEPSAFPGFMGIHLAQSDLTYRELYLIGQVAVHEQWALLTRLLFTKTSSANKSNALLFGGKFAPSPLVDFYLNVRLRKESEDVSAGGVEFHTLFHLNTLWPSDDERETVLSIMLESLRYSEDRRTDGLTERGVRLGISHEWSSGLSMGLYVARKNYTESPSRLGPTIDSRRFEFDTVMGLLSSFPRSFVGFITHWEFTDQWKLSPFFAHHKLLVDSDKTNTFGVQFEWEATKVLRLLADISQSRTDRKKDENLFGLSALYTW